MACIRICMNKGCGVRFVPRSNRQLWCDACLADPEALRRRGREYKRRQREREKNPEAGPPCQREPVFRALGGRRIGSVSSWRGLAVAPDGTVGKFCRDCGRFFAIRNVRQVRCPACQKAERRRQLAAYMRKRREKERERRRAARLALFLEASEGEPQLGLEDTL